MWRHWDLFKQLNQADYHFLMAVLLESHFYLHLHSLHHTLCSLWSLCNLDPWKSILKSWPQKMGNCKLRKYNCYFYHLMLCIFAWTDLNIQILTWLFQIVLEHGWFNQYWTDGCDCNCRLGEYRSLRLCDHIGCCNMHNVAEDILLWVIVFIDCRYY